MKVGVPTEIKVDEYRVALTPAGVRELVDTGTRSCIQAGAGMGSAIPDAEYLEQGAEIVADAVAVFEGAELIVKVKEPQPARSRCSSRTTSSSPTCTSPRRPNSRRAWSSRRRPASRTRP